MLQPWRRCRHQIQRHSLHGTAHQRADTSMVEVVAKRLLGRNRPTSNTTAGPFGAQRLLDLRKWCSPKERAEAWLAVDGHQQHIESPARRDERRSGGDGAGTDATLAGHDEDSRRIDPLVSGHGISLPGWTPLATSCVRILHRACVSAARDRRPWRTHRAAASLDDMTRTMVVGIDGSSGSDAALEWADAHRTEWEPLQPAFVWHSPWSSAIRRPGRPGVGVDEKLAQQALDEILSRHPKIIHGPPLLLEGHTGRQLVDASRTAGILVVGSRGRGAIGSAMLGSVSTHCARHSEVPVAVIPEPRSDAPIERVVVGIDGTPASVAALTFALTHFSDHTITALHAWVPPGGSVELVGLDPHQVEDSARLMLDRTVDEAMDAVGSTRPIEKRLVLGDPRVALRPPANGMLVVGRLGHRRVSHLLLGSTAAGLIHRPEAPIVVVPAPDE